jgi:site-specific recombinase XerD
VSLKARPRKTSTVAGYREMIRNHLRPWFGETDLARLSQQPEAWERYAATKLDAGLAAKTVRNHLVLAGLLFKTARRWRWVSENPLELVDPPPLPEPQTETLSASEVASF